MSNAKGSRTVIYPCIKCPTSCEIVVVEREDGSLEVSGNVCKLGNEYVRKEHTSPERNVTTTVKLLGAAIPRLPVRTSCEVPKDRVMEVMAHSARVLVQAPVKEGDVVLAAVAGTKADLIACRSLDRV